MVTATTSSTCDFAAFLQLHRSLDGVGVERIQILFAAAIEPHGAGVDALLNCGVWHLFDQYADFQGEPP